MSRTPGSTNPGPDDPPRPRLRALPILLLAVAGAGALWLATFGMSHREIRQSGPGGFPMPTFRLPVLDSGLLAGDTTFLSSAELKGHVVLLDYWATWCQPCIAEQPLLTELQDDYGGSGLRVVGVLADDSTERAFAWLRANHRTGFFTVVGDEKVVRDGHVGGLPATLLVDRDGQVVERFDGYSMKRDPYMRKRVRELTVRR